MAAGNVNAYNGVTVKLDGTPVSFTAEAMSLVSGKTYRVTNAIKRCFDPNTALEIRDNGVAVAPANIEAIDYLHGLVIFAAAYTPTTPITAHAGSYVPFVTLGTAESFSVEISAEALPKSVFGNAAKRYARGLADFTGNIGLISFLDDNVGVEALEASFAAGNARIVSIEIVQDGTTLANGGLVFRGRVNLSSAETSADPAALVKTPIDLEGSPVASVTGVSGSWPVAWSILDGSTALRI